MLNCTKLFLAYFRKIKEQLTMNQISSPNLDFLLVQHKIKFGLFVTPTENPNVVVCTASGGEFCQIEGWQNYWAIEILMPMEWLDNSYSLSFSVFIWWGINENPLSATKMQKCLAVPICSMPTVLELHSANTLFLKWSLALLSLITILLPL